MTAPSRSCFLILLVVVISLAFLWIIRQFLLTIMLAAMFPSRGLHGIHRQLARGLGGREKPAAILTLPILLALVVTPLLLVAGAVANEALRINETMGPRIEKLSQPGELDRWLRRAPGYEFIEPYRVQILTRVGEFVGSPRGIVFNALLVTTRRTVLFFRYFVVMLYTMFFFLTHGPRFARTHPAVHPPRGSGQAAHARQVRVRDACHAQGHDPDWRRAGRARRHRVLVRGHRGRDFVR